MKKYYLVRQKLEVLLDAADSDEEKEDTKESEAAKKRRLQRQAEEREAKFDEETLEMEGQYCALKAALLALRPKKNESLSSSGSGEGAETMSRVKLPDIKLPGFDGKLRDWIPFRDTFFSLIHNNERLSDIDKFTYLRSAISGEALQEISSIELSSDNYQVACNMLEKRYENKKLIVKAYLDALFGIEPLKKESGKALNHLVSDFDRNIQMLGKIGEDTDKWSTLLAYMLCTRLDSVTLRQWESHHNSKDVPTYQKVMDFLRDQALVLQSIAPSRSEDIESRRYRTTVHTTSRIQNNCVFCGNSFHPASACGKFRAMSVPQRFGVVKMKRLCINCLGSGHFADRCSKGPCHMSFHVLPKITSDLPTTKVSLNGIKMPHDLVLADPEFWSPGPIDMIIGAEYFCNLLRSGKCKVSDDGPTLQETEFGWVVSGRVPDISFETFT
ncbi:uncharacterized protein LOC129752250 [Uranotaenia lowii]|uniref:uncharacterized protein LOC129752250 n=1 Tax=Uranotaenia lowii TaxID=190385 RepID=UPI0024790A88|nr:uncharacterized protein LOC129752250 [Uranotaenia lowii]